LYYYETHLSLIVFYILFFFFFFIPIWRIYDILFTKIKNVRPLERKRKNTQKIHHLLIQMVGIKFVGLKK